MADDAHAVTTERPIVLALDTTTRAGSIAILRQGIIDAVFVGDGSKTHGERLPGDISVILNRSRLRLEEIDLFAVVAGPGSFTGLRVGIAAIQGLALAQQKKVVAVPALEALALSPEVPPGIVGVWMDAQRQQVFAALFAKTDASSLQATATSGSGRGGATLTVLREPVSWPPHVVVERWRAEGIAPSTLVGDGVDRYGESARAAWPSARAVIPAPPLAPVAAMIAGIAPERAVPPHAIVPIYVRAADAELARGQPRQVDRP